MRKPSRQMPKRPPPKPTTLFEDIFWRIVGIGILGGCLWGLYKTSVFFWTHPAFLIGPIIFIMVLAVSGKIHDKKWRLQLNKLAKPREGESICTFARHFNCREVDTWIIRAVYEELQDEIYEYENFPIRPSDKFISDLGIFEENLNDYVYEDIAGRAGRSWENCESNPYYDKVNTVADMIYFFNHQPKIA